MKSFLFLWKMLNDFVSMILFGLFTKLHTESFWAAIIQMRTAVDYARIIQIVQMNRLYRIVLNAARSFRVYNFLDISCFKCMLYVYLFILHGCFFCFSVRHGSTTPVRVKTRSSYHLTTLVNVCLSLLLLDKWGCFMSL